MLAVAASVHRRTPWGRRVHPAQQHHAALGAGAEEGWYGACLPACCACLRLLQVLSEMANPNLVVQHYLTNPLLLHGFKFDMRVYALVLCADPLRVFLYHEGLARLCTEKYTAPKTSNINVTFMHLTNYAVRAFAPRCCCVQRGALRWRQCWQSRMPHLHGCLCTAHFAACAARLCYKLCQAPGVVTAAACIRSCACVQVNKKNPDFVPGTAMEGGEDASKWTFAQLADHMRSEGEHRGARRGGGGGAERVMPFRSSQGALQPGGVYCC